MTEAKALPRFKKIYQDTIRKALLEEFKYDNEMQIPRISKVVLNMGVGEATGDSKKPSVAAADLALLPVKRLSLLAPVIRSQLLSCVKICQSVRRSLFVRIACTNS